MHRRLPVFAVVLLLFVAGCDSGSGTPETIIGEWRGSFVEQNVTHTVFLSLEQTSPTQVLGTGSVDSSEGTLQADVSGTYAHPDVTLSLRFDNQRPATLQGTVSEDRSTIDARIIGSDFDGTTFELERQ